MVAPEPKSCPRCNQPFECKPDNITECQCFGLRFTIDEKAYIGRVSRDCLCRNCLLLLQRDARMAGESLRS